MVQGQCVPFTFADEFQRIRDCLAELGCSPAPAETSFVVDIRPADRVSITGTSFVTIIQYDVPDDFKLQLKEVFVSLLGFSAEFVVEHSRDLINWCYIRSFICNVQMPNFTETFGGALDYLPKTIQEPHSRIRIRARMNGGAGNNLNGSVFASLNGFLLSYP